MAADDDDRGSAPDPWDEIAAGDLGGEAEIVPFQFGEAGDEAAESPPEAGGSEDPEPAEAAAGLSDADVIADAGNGLVEDWLSESEGVADDEPGPLSVFDPEGTAEAAAPVPAADGDTDASAAEAWPGTDDAAGEASGDGDTADGLPDVAAAAAVAVGPATTGVQRRLKPKKKAGGIGQVIGIVLGGLLAIPIVAGLLIGYVWIGGPDTMGLSKTPLAFLLPTKSKLGGKGVKPQAAASGDVAEVSPLDGLDSLPTATEPAEPGAGPVDEGADESAMAEPADLVDADMGMPPEPEPEPAPEPEPVPGVAAIEPPGLDDIAAAEPPVAPPPLDTAALDEAIGDAEALGRALGTVEDRTTTAYDELRTRWYRALARVAEELVAVENAAATSGRPLAAAPDNVAALHGGIGGREPLAVELSVLAPDWLAYANRGSDGVVLPVTFKSARQVGPYWSARMSLTDGDGQAHDLTVISLREPAAISGDRLVVTGVVLDGGVIWAADVRAGGGLAAGF